MAIFIAHSQSYGQVGISVVVGTGLNKPKGYILPPYGNFFYSPVVGVQGEQRFSFGLSSKLSSTLTLGLEYFDAKEVTESDLYDPSVSYSPSYSNHYYLTYNFSKQYLGVPLTCRLNYQPLNLVEDFTVYLGIGVSLQALIRANLHEKATSTTFDDMTGEVLIVDMYDNTQVVTNLCKRYSTFLNIEVGLTFQRFTFSIRHKLSNVDSTPQGLQTHSIVPTAYSAMQLTHYSGIRLDMTDSEGNPFAVNEFYEGPLKEIYTEVVMRFRINKLKKF